MDFPWPALFIRNNWDMLYKLLRDAWQRDTPRATSHSWNLMRKLLNYTFGRILFFFLFLFFFQICWSRYPFPTGTGGPASNLATHSLALNIKRGNWYKIHHQKKAWRKKWSSRSKRTKADLVWTIVRIALWRKRRVFSAWVGGTRVLFFSYLGQK